MASYKSVALFLFPIWALLSACSGGGGGGGGVAAVSLPTVSPTPDASGQITTTIKPDAASTISASALTGGNPLSALTTIDFPSGSVGKATDVKIFETASVVSKIDTASIGVDSLTSGGPAMFISGDDSALTLDITVHIPYDSSLLTALRLAASSASLGVLGIYSDGKVEIFTGSGINKEDKVLDVQTRHFGVYQAIQLMGTVKNAVVTSTVSIDSLKPVAGTTSSTDKTSATTTTKKACADGTVDGGTATRTRYQATSVTYGQTCVSESQTASCTDGTLGTWSGTYTFDSCSVGAAASCGSTASGQSATRTKYQATSVAYGQTCVSESQTATCTDGTLGTWSGTYTYDSCSVGAAASCGSTSSGQQASRTKYQSSSVASGQTCTSEVQHATCTNGTLGSWSGNYTNDSCTVNAAGSCGSVANGQQSTRTKYLAASVAYGQTCTSESQTATCTNGTLGTWSGSYTYDSCSVGAAASCGSTASGQQATRTKYLAASVAYGQTCTSQSQTATCNNGTLGAWSGSYTYDSCSVGAAASCGSTASGQQASRTKYLAASVAYGQTCTSESQTAMCTNGTLGVWSGTYTFDSCSVATAGSCGSTASGQQATRTRYQYATLASGQTCTSEAQHATCTNGTLGAWSGTYTYASCLASAMLTGTPSDPSTSTSLDITVGGSGVTSYSYGIWRNTASCPTTFYDDNGNFTCAVSSGNDGGGATTGTAVSGGTGWGSNNPIDQSTCVSTTNHIQTDLSSIAGQSLLVCVWGSNDAGDLQAVGSPTSYRWTYTPSSSVSYSSSASLQNPQYLAGKTIATGTSIGENIAAASAGNTLYVVYSDNQNVKLAMSTNNGTSWSTSAIVDNSSTALRGYTLGIATGTSAGSVFVIAGDTATFAKSVDYGAHWTFTTLDANGGNGDSNPSIVVNGNNIYLSYPSFASDPSQASLKFAKSTDSGGTWASGNIKTIETSAGWDMPSSITYDSGKIYLAYVATYLDEQNANYQRLTLATSTDTGATWTKSYPTQNPPNGYRSAISVGGNNMKILVENNLYSSTDGGSTWSDSNSSNNSKDSNNSNVSFGTGANFVVNGSSVVVSYYTTDNNGNNSLGIGNSTDSAGTFTLQTVGADADGWQTAIVNGNNKLFAFYKSMGGNQIYATSSSDSGVTWGTVSHTINLSHKAIGGSFPASGEGVVSMATDGTNVYAIDGDNGYIMKAALSSDGTWTTGRLPSNVGYWGAAMTATNQGVYIIAGGSGDTQVLRSTDHGTTFSSSSIEAGSSNGDGRQGIAVVGNNVYVCYPNIDFSTDAKTEYLKFAKSTDGGVTWSAGNIKTIATAPSWGSTCSITAYNGNLYIAFVLGDMNSSQLKFAKSTNDGSTWSTTLVDDRTGNGSLTLPAIAASADGVFIVDGALFYRSTTVGATWPSATEVSGDSNTYGGSNMSFVGSNMIVTYLDSNNHELFATLSTDHGGSWSQPVVVDADDAPGGFWARTGLAVSGSNVYVGYPSNKAQGVVKANKSTNGGASFSWP